MTTESAIKIVRRAMRVVVDAILDENSNPKESYQRKYEHLRAVDEKVLPALYKVKNGSTVSSKTVLDYQRLGKKIYELYHDKWPFNLSGMKPRRWMFKAMAY